MNVKKGLHEILTTQQWAMHPDVLASLRSAIRNNILGRMDVDSVPAMEGSFLTTLSGGFENRLYVGDADSISDIVELGEGDSIINVLNVSGPITREGGGCSFGSRDHRDWLMRAADIDEVIGHVFMINSGGGSAFAIADYQQAVDYIRSKGQKIIAYIDGMACSAAYGLASMADEIYVMNLGNQVGCIGTMCSYYLQSNGDVNAITQERYVELYAETSPYKNREHRDMMSGNEDSTIEDLNKFNDKFVALIRQNRPQVTDEQLKGDTYDAADSVGTLVDGQKTFAECLERLLEISGYTFAGGLLVPQAVVSGDENEDIENNDINLKPNYDMSKEYPLIMAAVQAPALESDQEDAVYLHKEFCENLEARLAAAEQMEAALAEKTAELAALTERLDAIEAAHAEEIEKLNGEYAAAAQEAVLKQEEAIEKMTAEHEEAIKALEEKAAADMETLVASHDALVAELNSKLEEAGKSLAAKEAEILELAEQPATHAKGEAPEHNAAAAATKVRESITAVRPGMSAQERREALKATYERLTRKV